MSVVGSVSVRVVPSFSNFHTDIGSAFRGANRPVTQAAATLGAAAGTSFSISANNRIIQSGFVSSFRNAFGQSAAIAQGEGGIAGRSWAHRAASSITGNSGGVSSAIHQPFTGALSGITSVGNATGLSFVNAEASSLAQNTNTVQHHITQPFTGAMADVVSAGNATGLRFTDATAVSLGTSTNTVQDAVTRPFTGVMSDVSSAGNATGLSFSNAAVSSLGAQTNSVKHAVKQPFSGVMSEVTSVGAATGVSFSNAATSSIAQGADLAGESFTQRLGSAIGGAMGALTTEVSQHALSIGASLTGIGDTAQSIGDQIASVGGSLTTGITAPAGIAAAAVGGLVGVLGFRRLVGIDTARAKLVGLGYDAQEVERISEQVTDAIEGTMITMGEGTDIAAGALAAGVEQGEELQRYIRLVGDAAIAGGTQIDWMAQVFNRVQGQGRLMLGELNMLERQVPGVTAALAESYGVSQDAFREMVSAGEVDAAHFLDVMEDFMGGMGAAYADSWEGMAKNTAAWTGIIGQNILEGAFQEAKVELNEFLQWLSSDDVQAWALATGETMTRVFMDVVAWVRDAIDWWNELDESTQKWFGIIAGAAVALGPFLLIGGKLIGFLGGLVSSLGTAFTWVGSFTGAIAGSTTATGAGATAAGIFGRAIAILTGPIGWVITGLIAMWVSSEEFRSAMIDLGLVIWDSLLLIRDALMPVVDLLWQVVLPAIAVGVAWLAETLGDVLAWTIEHIVIPVVEWLVDRLVIVIDWIVGLGDTSTEQGAFMREAWDRIAETVASAWENWILPALSAMWDMLVNFADWWVETGWPALREAWQSFAETVQNVWNDYLRPAFEGIWDALVDFANWWVETGWPEIKSRWEDFGETVEDIWDNYLRDIFVGIAESAVRIKDSFVEMWENHLKDMWEDFRVSVGDFWDEHEDTLKLIAEFLALIGGAVVIAALFTVIGTLKLVELALESLADISELVVLAMEGDWDEFNLALARGALDTDGILFGVGISMARLRQSFLERVTEMTAGFYAMVRDFRQEVLGRLTTTFVTFRERVTELRDRFGDRMDSMKRTFSEMSAHLQDRARNSIAPTFQTLVGVTTELRDRFGDRMASIRERFSEMAAGLQDTWERHIRPMLGGFGDFVFNDLPRMISDGVDRIREAFGKVANFFRDPIDWVITNVWNDGIMAAINRVIEALPISDSKKMSPLGGIGYYANGGRPHEDWYVAGEEGPELIHRGSESHRVYTASQTREALAQGMARRGEDVHPDHEAALLGSTPSESLLPVGGAVRDLLGRISDRASQVMEWLRGSLVSSAEALLARTSGIKNLAGEMAGGGAMGDIGQGMADWGVKELLSFAKGEDDKAGEFGFDGTPFDGERGSFFRPSRGPITSWFGPRWGTIHSGIDIAGGGPTYAAYAGRVARTGNGVLPGRTGLGILLNHGGGLSTYYGHNPVGGIRVAPGDEVSRGQRIGAQGATGNVTGIHLHWERLMNGRAQNVNSMFRDKGGLMYPGVGLYNNQTGGAEYISNQRQFDNLNAMAERATDTASGLVVNQYGMDYSDSRAVVNEFGRAQKRAARGGALVR